VVAQQTFAWGSVRVLGKVPANDAVVIVAVTIITVFTDLATAVLCGILIAALAFAWQHSRDMRSDVHDNGDARVYTPHGTLFFASTTHFQALFDPQNDPDQVYIDCRHLHMVDHSAIAAMENLAARYGKFGKQLQLRQLSARNQRLLERAHAAVTIA